MSDTSLTRPQATPDGSRRTGADIRQGYAPPPVSPGATTILIDALNYPDRRPTAEKRQAALDAGATAVVDGSGEGVTQRILDACGGPVLAIIDLVNGSATAAFAFPALRKGGKLVQVGLFGGDVTIPLPTMTMRALTMQGSYVGNPKELRELVALAQNGRVEALPITRMPRAQTNEALMRLRDGRVTGRIVLEAS